MKRTKNSKNVVKTDLLRNPMDVPSPDSEISRALGKNCGGADGRKETRAQKGTCSSPDNITNSKLHRPTLFKECHMDHLKTKPKSTLHTWFRWLLRKDKIPSYGSTSNLSKTPPEHRSARIHHSISADTPSKMKKAHKAAIALGISGQSPQLTRGRLCKRNSDVSIMSETSSVSVTSRSKKRPAPPPPVKNLVGLNKLSESSSSINSHLSWGSLRLKNKLKGPAPRPPDAQNSSSTNLSRLSSKFSVGASSSGISTMQSNSSFLSDQEGSVFSNPFPSLKTGEGSLSPKPWYKRSKNKSKKREAAQPHEEAAYDMWMPEVQYSRKTLESKCPVVSSTIQSLIQEKRCSALSNISDLDQAAAEVVRKAKMAKIAEKENYDCKFYNTSAHILKQTDFGNEELVEPDTNDNLMYDNIPVTHPIPQDHTQEKPTDDSHFIEEKVEPCSAEQINTSDTDDELPMRHPIYSLKQKPTPIQKAVDDPELFYSMAKDTKGKGLAKNCQADIMLKEISSSQKNFGFRMNNIFTPDVSTILEGSESVTSSTTVTDDVERDFQALAAMSLDPNEILSTTSDFRIDTLDLDDIVDNFAQESSLNENTNDKSLASFLKKQENENLSTWQDLKRQADEGSFDQEVSSAERNSKWICDTCTLINNPWRLHCEACSSLRLPRPQRVDDHGRIIDFASIGKHNMNSSPVLSRIPADANDQKLQSDSKDCASHITLTQDEVRQARLKKFDFVNVSTKENDINSLKDKFENCQVDQTKSILKSVAKAEFQTKVDEFESFLLESRKKSLSDKKYRKLSPINTNGAVRNVVSLFNQKEQTKPAEVFQKTPRRPSLASSHVSDDALPDNISECSSGSNRAKNMKLDIDIMTAINKFDEMAAIAEVVHLNQLSPKTSTMKKQRNVHSNQTKHLAQSVSGSSLDTLSPNSSTPTSPNDNLSWITSRSVFNQTKAPLAENNPVRIPPKIQARSDSFDKARKRFAMNINDDNHKRNSISVGSGTFELMAPREFACISAQHSERPSPTREIPPEDVLTPEETLSVSLSTDSGKNDSEESPLDITQDEDTTKRINDHLKQLEQAISKGNHAEAAALARELARMQLACSGGEDIKSEEPLKEDSGVKISDEPDKKDIHTRDQRKREDNIPNSSKIEVQNASQQDKSARRAVKSMAADTFLEKPIQAKPFNVEMYIEDRTTHQGPISLEVTTSLTVKQLREKVQNEFGFPKEVQRWILGRQLADDDGNTLSYYKVTTNKCPIFLYLVAPEVDTKTLPDKKPLNFVLETPVQIETPVNPSISVTQPVVADDESHKGARRRNVSKKQPTKKLKKRSGDPRISRKNGPQLLNVGVSSSTNSSSPDVGSSSTSTGSTLDRRSSGDTSQKSPGNLKIAVETTPKNFWTCPVCTLQNATERPGCEACSTERPELKDDDAIDYSAYETRGCIPNAKPFECAICFIEYNRKEGVVLRECLHTFCRPCLRNAIIFSEHAAVKCPFMDDDYSCDFSLQDREIKDLVTEDEYRMHHEKSVRQATGSMSNVFHCKTVDCKGFCQFEDNVNVFKCHVCSKINCLTCQAQHEGMSCKEYQDDINTKKDAEAMETKKFFDDIIRRGNGMFCPSCSVMLVRKWGCDWMRCPMCRCEICWVTRGPRWGPNGQGDTSGGCKCGINGRKCHPKCTYCH